MCPHIFDQLFCVSIVAGSDCSLLKCVEAPPFACPNGLPGSFVAWNADINTQYWIVIDGTGVRNNEFVLTAQTMEGPTNDSCGKAITIGVGETLTGETLFGDTQFLDRPTCAVEVPILSAG